MPFNNEGTCQDCLAWYRDNPTQEMGVCRANPPTALPPSKGKSTSIWPITNEHQWCYFGRSNAMPVGGLQ